VQEHNHPHILLLQIGNTFCKLPGGRLKPGENEADGLKRKLTSKLGGNSAALVPDWTVGECVATWWRPNFETMMYPYCPPHITKPKVVKKHNVKLLRISLYSSPYISSFLWNGRNARDSTLFTCLRKSTLLCPKI